MRVSEVASIETLHPISLLFEELLESNVATLYEATLNVPTQLEFVDRLSRFPSLDACHR